MLSFRSTDVYAYAKLYLNYEYASFCDTINNILMQVLGKILKASRGPGHVRKNERVYITTKKSYYIAIIYDIAEGEPSWGTC